MSERLEKIKAHIKEHKVEYACAVTAVVVATFTTIIVRGRYEALATGGAYGLETADTSVTMRPLAFLSRQGNSVSVTNKFGRGRPGYLIRDLDTDEYFRSQRSAASTRGISETILSKHLNGILPDAEGYTFERIRLAE